MRKLIPQSECKDKIKLYKCLKTKSVIPGRPKMTVKDQHFYWLPKSYPFFLFNYHKNIFKNI